MTTQTDTNNLFTGLLTWPTQTYAPPSITITSTNEAQATVVLRQLYSDLQSVVYLSPNAVSIIQRLCDNASIDPSTALTNALTLAEYIHKEQVAGSTLLLQGKDNIVRQIFFPETTTTQHPSNTMTDTMPNSLTASELTYKGYCSKVMGSTRNGTDMYILDTATGIPTGMTYHVPFTDTSPNQYLIDRVDWYINRLKRIDAGEKVGPLVYEIVSTPQRSGSQGLAPNREFKSLTDTKTPHS